MNTDIRLSVEFWQHPKTYRLEKRIGLKGVRSLQMLWCWCAKNRPDGNLEGLDVDEIEFVADWRGKKGAFVEACIGSWIDQTDSGFWLHEWADYNPYQAQAGSREEARREKARKAANARWQKTPSDDATGCSNDATSNAQAYANDVPSICSDDAKVMLEQCSNDATSNAQAMPTLTSTSTKDIKGNLRIPPLSPQGECEGGRKKSRKNTPAPEKPKTDEGDMQEEPSIEFQELRIFWDKEMRCEGPLAGFREYKMLKKARDSTGMSCWPGLSVIAEDVAKRKQARVWNPGYEIGLGRYLAEKTWLAPVVPRASPIASQSGGKPSEGDVAARKTWENYQNLKAKGIVS